LTSDGDTTGFGFGFGFVVAVVNAPESGNCDGVLVDMAVLGAAC